MTAIGQKRIFKDLAAIDRSSAKAEVVIFWGTKYAQLVQAVKQPL